MWPLTSLLNISSAIVTPYWFTDEITPLAYYAKSHRCQSSHENAATYETKDQSNILTGTVWVYVMSTCVVDYNRALVASVAGCFSYFYIHKRHSDLFLLLPSTS